MRTLPLLLLVFSTCAWAVKGEYVEGHDLTSTCKLTFFVKQDEKVLTGTCTASFVGNKTFVTAEHCYEDVATNQEMVKNKNLPHDSYFTCPGSDKKYIAKNLFPMKFSGLDEIQDIAVIKVEEEVDAKPILLPRTSEELETALKDTKNCFVSGYGLDNENKYGVLRTARLTNVENRPLDIFNSGNRNRVRIRGNYADHGDSGGPLYCETPEGVILIGVVHGGMKGLTFSDIEKLNIGLEWITYHKNFDVDDEEAFKKVLRNADMCNSLIECSEAMKKINALTADTDKIMKALLKESEDARTQILIGGEVSTVKLSELWEEMLREWERNDCFKKLYP